MPRTPRKNQVDFSRHNTYHVITRCTRQLFLLGSCDESREQRKGVLLAQLQKLARFTAIGVGGFSVMDNHMHLLLKVDVEQATAWSTREVAERWLALHPPRNGYFKVIDVDEDHIATFCADAERIEACRDKLMSISQFMKELKQETTQQLNKLDNTVGSLWAGRFKCKAVTDENYLLAALAYIDLNPFAAGICELPEQGRHTSLDARLNGETTLSKPNKQTKEATTPPDTKSKTKRTLDQAINERQGWWLSIDQTVERTQTFTPDLAHAFASTNNKPRLAFGAYLKLLDASARLLRDGKNQLASDMKAIGSRLSITPVQVTAQIRYWLDHGFEWARLEPGLSC